MIYNVPTKILDIYHICDQSNIPHWYIIEYKNNTLCTNPTQIKTPSERCIEKIILQ